MGAVRSQKASQTMLDFTADLLKAYRREVDHPAVADGEDEGSQRSALTLTTRMWPLTSHIETERTWWTVGICGLLKIVLTMLAKLKRENIIEEHAQEEFIIHWSPILPRDKESLVNEASVRAPNKLGSKRHIMSLFDDITDPEEQLDEIREESDLDAPKQPKIAPINIANANTKTGGTNASQSD